jgi:hypothetical protein
MFYLSVIISLLLLGLTCFNKVDYAIKTISIGLSVIIAVIRVYLFGLRLTLTPLYNCIYVYN